MKLYTEKQVLQMLEVCRDTDLYEHILTFDDILKTETPIELPSDEEIERKIEYTIDKEFKIGSLAFIDRAKWMRDKIQGENQN